jgi:hypothetical protein
VTPLLDLLVPCLLIVTVGYALWSAASPWGTCWHCHGDKHGDCRHCDGTGLRPRLSWRAAAYLIRAWKDSHL